MSLFLWDWGEADNFVVPKGRIRGADALDRLLRHRYGTKMALEWFGEWGNPEIRTQVNDTVEQIRLALRFGDLTAQIDGRDVPPSWWDSDGATKVILSGMVEVPIESPAAIRPPGSTSLTGCVDLTCSHDEFVAWEQKQPLPARVGETLGSPANHTLLTKEEICWLIFDRAVEIKSKEIIEVELKEKFRGRIKGKIYKEAARWAWPGPSGKGNRTWVEPLKPEWSRPERLGP